MHAFNYEALFRTEEEMFFKPIQVFPSPVYPSSHTHPPPTQEAYLWHTSLPHRLGGSGKKCNMYTEFENIYSLFVVKNIITHKHTAQKC
jgi:hypothetical protein